jgi:hypothetical protein
VSELTDAERELYQAPFEAFVATRDRLVGALKAAGEKAAATALAKRKRPSVSAWAVNQLWWHARADVDALFATASRLRAGELASSAAHREVLARLRARATALLADGGHPPSEATLRRVAGTLSAIAAAGGFDPDLPGALVADRDPPGFEALAAMPAVAAPPPAAPRLDAAERERVEHERVERERVERERVEHEARERAIAERRRLEAELAAARRRVDDANRRVEQARGVLAAAQAELAAAVAAEAKLQE